MAPISKILALATATFAVTGTAAPLNARDKVVVWETVTDIVWTTIDITKTVYADQVPATAAADLQGAVSPVAKRPQKPHKPHKPQRPHHHHHAQPVDTPAANPTPAAVAPAPEQASSNSQPAASPATPAPTTAAAPASDPPAPASPSPATPAPKDPPASSSPAPSNGGSSSSGGGSDPAPSSSGSSGSSSGYNGACSKSSPCTGDITFYDTATSASNPSSCGTTNDGSTENVLALPVGIMTDGDCGKTVTIKYGGKTATGTVVDKCMGCDNNSIDLSRHLFGELADFSAGRVGGVQWWIN